MPNQATQRICVHVVRVETDDFVGEAKVDSPSKNQLQHLRKLARALGYPGGTIATAEELSFLDLYAKSNHCSYHNLGNTVRKAGWGPVMPPGYQWCRQGARVTPQPRYVDIRFEDLPKLEKLRIMGSRDGILRDTMKRVSMFPKFWYHSLSYIDRAKAFGIEVEHERHTWPKTA